MGLKQIALAMGVGYVLGAKAGEHRYAQIKELWSRTGGPLAESPSVQRLGELGRDAISHATEVVVRQAQRGSQRVAAVRERGRVDDVGVSPQQRGAHRQGIGR